MFILVIRMILRRRPGPKRTAMLIAVTGGGLALTGCAVHRAASALLQQRLHADAALSALPPSVASIDDNKTLRAPSPSDE